MIDQNGDPIDEHSSLHLRQLDDDKREPLLVPENDAIDAAMWRAGLWGITLAALGLGAWGLYVLMQIVWRLACIALGIDPNV